MNKMRVVIAPLGVLVELSVSPPSSFGQLGEVKRQVDPASATYTNSPNAVVDHVEIEISDVIRSVWLLLQSGRHGPYMEFFNYDSLVPLSPKSCVAANGTLLLFMPRREALSVVLQCVSASAGGAALKESHPWATMPVESNAVAEAEVSKCVADVVLRWSRVEHLRRAVEALDGPLDTQTACAENELRDACAAVGSTRERLSSVSAALGELQTKLAAQTLFSAPENTLDAYVRMDKVTKAEKALQQAQLRIDDASGIRQSIDYAILNERKTREEFAETEAWKCALHTAKAPATQLSTTEECADDPERTAAKQRLVDELKRRMREMRSVLTQLVKIRKLSAKAKNYCSAVDLSVLQRYSSIAQLPDAVLAARSLAKRRVLLRRAARRLLVVLESEHIALDRQREQFVEQWSSLIPDSMNLRSLRDPLPSLYPPEDVAAAEFDRCFIDIDDDETDNLLTSLGAKFQQDDPKKEETTDAILAVTRQQLEESNAKVLALTKHVSELQEELKAQRIKLDQAARSRAEIEDSLVKQFDTAEREMEHMKQEHAKSLDELQQKLTKEVLAREEGVGSSRDGSCRISNEASSLDELKAICFDTLGGNVYDFKFNPSMKSMASVGPVIINTPREYTLKLLNAPKLENAHGGRYTVIQVAKVCDDIIHVFGAVN